MKLYPKGLYLLPILVLTLLVPTLPAQSTVGDPALAKQLVGTLAGENKWSGEGDEATEATLPFATDFLFAPNGELLAAGPGSHRIYRLAPDGMLRRFAGTGERGSSGDGGPKEEARFDSPTALAFDAEGNLYVGERAYLRKISPLGIVSTLAGNGSPGCPGVSGDAMTGPVAGISRIAIGPDGEIYFLACRALYKLSGGQYQLLLQTGGSKGEALKIGPLEVPASSWRAGQIYDFTVHPNGDIYIADDGTGEVYALTPQGIVRRIAGARGLSSFPQATEAVNAYLVNIRALGLLPSGEILVPDRTSEIAVIGTDGSYRALAQAALPVLVNGTSVPEQVTISTFRVGPDNVAYLLASAGQIYRIADPPALHLALGYVPLPVNPPTPDSTFQSSFFSQGTADAEENVYVAINVPGEPGQRIFKITPSGEVSHYAGDGSYVDNGVTAPATAITIPYVSSLHAGPDGSVYFGKLLELRGGIWKITPAGTVEAAVGGGGEVAPIDLTGKRARDLSFLWDGNGVLSGSFTLSPIGEIYFRRRTPAGFDPRQFIWKVGVDGFISLAAGGGGPLIANADGLRTTEISVQFFQATYVDSANRLYFTFSAPGESSLRMYRVDPDGIVRHFAGNGQTALPVVGQALTDAPLSSCTSVNFVAPGEFLCLAGGVGQVYRFREGNPISLVLQAGSVYQNDGGYLGDDTAAATIPGLSLPGGAFFARSGTSPNLSVRRTWIVHAGCTYQLSANALTVSSAGHEGSIAISTGANCPWSAGTSNRWISLDGPRFGKGSASIRFRAKANPSVDERVSVLSIAGNRIPITQLGSTSPALFVAPLAVTIPAAGGEETMTITATNNAPWLATVSHTWLQFASASAGNGSASVRVLASANNSTALRVGKVTVNGKEMIVRQSAASGNAGDTAKLNALVEGAGFRKLPVAPASIASLFGEGLAAGEDRAKSVPLPTTLGGVQLRVRSGSYSQFAGLFYVSATQINFLVPEDCPMGGVTLELLSAGNLVGSLPISVSPIVPSLFSANSNGKGAPAGYTVSVKNGVQKRGEVYACASQFPCEPIPVNYGESGSEVFLILFGTGFRGRPNLPEVRLGGTPAEVTYAGPQGSFVGLDQINIKIPATVRGLGLLNVDIVHGNSEANTVQVNF